MPKLNVRDTNFSGHETFCFRYGWLKKGVDAVKVDPFVFSKEEALVVLGVGKNMVRSIRHWCLAARLIEERPNDGRTKRMVVTDLGEMIFGENGFDPFLEDPGTLWILHWLIASNQALSTTWHFAFSYLTTPDFTKDSLVKSILLSLKESDLAPQSESTIKRDVDCFVRTYVTSELSTNSMLEDSFDCPLVDLQLIQPTTDARTYYFNRGDHPTLDGFLFAFILADYWKDKKTPNLTYEQVAHLPGSPGRLLKIDESSLFVRLDELELITDGAFSYEESSGLRQLHRKRVTDSNELLRAHYTRFKGATRNA